MRPAGRNLDAIVHAPQKGMLKRIGPWNVQYNPLREAEKLLKDPLVLQTGASQTDVAYFLAQAYSEHKLLYACSQAVDTIDRFSKLFSETVQHALAPFALPIEAVEMGIEVAAKAPFFIALAWKSHTRHLIPWLFAREVTTSAIPYVGDAYDILTNAYIHAATEAITEYGRDKILDAYEPVVSPKA